MPRENHGRPRGTTRITTAAARKTASPAMTKRTGIPIQTRLDSIMAAPMVMAAARMQSEET